MTIHKARNRLQGLSRVLSGEGGNELYLKVEFLNKHVDV
jgi:hypothetical protein